MIIERADPLDDAGEGDLDIEVELLLRWLRGLAIGRPGRSPSTGEHTLLLVVADTGLCRYHWVGRVAVPCQNHLHICTNCFGIGLNLWLNTRVKHDSSTLVGGAESATWTIALHPPLPVEAGTASPNGTSVDILPVVW